MDTDFLRHSRTQALLLYDGECGLCSGVVRFLRRIDRRERLGYAALQSETGQAVLRRLGLPTEDFASLVFLPEGAEGARVFLKSDGALEALREVGGGWKVIAAMGRVLPRCWRDVAYTWVARWRHKIGGRKP